MPSEIIEMDIRGQVCPSCLLLALKMVNQQHSGLRSGQVRLAFLTDSRDATGTIPAAVENMGLSTRISKQAGYYRIEVGA